MRPFFFNCQIKRSEIERSIAQTFGEFDFDRSFSAIELNRSIKLDVIRLISITECSTTYAGPHQPPLPSPGLISNQTLQFFYSVCKGFSNAYLKPFLESNFKKLLSVKILIHPVGFDVSTDTRHFTSLRSTKVLSKNRKKTTSKMQLLLFKSKSRVRCFRTMDSNRKT